MLEQQATVTQVNGQKITIKSLQTSACQSCASQSSCGTSIYASFLPKRELILSSDLQLKQGDTVLIGIDEMHLVKASLFVYLLPLLLMLVCVGFYKGSDLMTAIVALGALTLGLWLVNQFQYLFISRWLQLPKIISKC